LLLANKGGETPRIILVFLTCYLALKLLCESSNVSTRDKPKSDLHISIVQLFSVYQIHTCCGFFWHVLQR